MDFKTRILHTGKDRDQYTGAASVPIYQVSTFIQDDPEHFRQYQYARGANPTRDALEDTIALLESGESGFAFSSGVAAISSVFLLFQPGDHIIVPEDVYGGTYRVLNTIFRRWRLRHTSVDMTDLGKIEAAITTKTKAIYVETPSNPLLRITDLAGVAELARRRGLVTIMDNTFMTPYLQRPLELGFDMVVHSATKFLGGHSDLIAGLAVAREKVWGKKLKNIQTGFGAILGPQDCWLVLRGIKTLTARMDAQQKNAEYIASRLVSQKGIKEVFYPTLSTHQGRDVHLRQSSGGGAVVSFEIDNGDLTKEFLRRIKLPLFAVSLGGVESIISYPATMSHSALPQDERYARGITDGVVRLSVGLEDPADILEDIADALRAAMKKVGSRGGARKKGDSRTVSG